MLKSMSIRSKLGVLVVIPIVAALIVTVIGTYYVNRISANLIQSVYDEGFQSISLILNADRDAYQALDNINSMLLKNNAGTLDQASKEALVKSYDENVGQVNDRTKQAIDILSKNKAYWDKLQYEADGLTVFDHYNAFTEDFTKWLGMAENVQNTYAPGEDYTAVFDSAREHLNVLGELVGTGVQKSIAAEQKSKSTMIMTMVIIDVIVLVIIVILSVFLIRAITDPLKKSVVMLQEMVKGKLSRRLSLKQRDELGILGANLDLFADNLQHNVVGTMKKISEGDLNLVIAVADPEDEISPVMKTTVENLKALVAEADMLTDAAINGQLSTRGNTEAFQGGYREIVSGVNKTLDAVIGPLKTAAEYFSRISNGDIPQTITEEYHGDFIMIRNSINRCIDAVNYLIEDTGMLTSAASDGKFTVRADADKHTGDFNRIISGINNTLDIIVEKIFWYESMLDSIPFPLSVTDNDMKWTFINQATTNVIGLKREDVMGQPCSNWNANICNTENCGIRCLKRGEGPTVFEQGGMNFQVNTTYLTDTKGGKIGHIEVVQDISASVKSSNYNKAEVERLAGNLKNLSEGILDLDFNILDADSYTKQDRENFLVINDNLKTARDSIQSIIDDASVLTRAAIEGQLKTRADMLKYKGAWKALVGGMNDILEEISRPLEEVSEVMNAISNGELSVSVRGSYKGEFDSLARKVNTTTDVLNGIVKVIADSTGSIAGGNLAIEHIQDFSGDFISISDSLNTIIEFLNSIIGEISDAAEQVASGSRQVSDGSQALSQGSTEQASSIEELTSSITEIASQTKQNAVDANQANQLATAAKTNAVQGNDRMKEMVSSMTDINESSANISKIIKVIDDIAFQTNILALNAAVEAARAGQHGKGFAVVAEEVRNLAARSADAAKETTDLIEGSISKVQTGTKIANDTAAALVEIVSGIEKAANLIGGIATASNEQASGIAQINKGIGQVSTVVQNNSATAEESAAASEELTGQAELLKQIVGRFKLNKSLKTLPGMAALPGSTASKLGIKKGAAPKIVLDGSDYDKY